MIAALSVLVILFLVLGPNDLRLVLAVAVTYILAIAFFA